MNFQQGAAKHREGSCRFRACFRAESTCFCLEYRVVSLCMASWWEGQWGSGGLCSQLLPPGSGLGDGHILGIPSWTHPGTHLKCVLKTLFLKEASHVLEFLPPFLFSREQPNSGHWLVLALILPSCVMSLLGSHHLGHSCLAPHQPHCFRLLFGPRIYSLSDLELGPGSRACVTTGNPPPFLLELCSQPLPACLQPILHATAEGAF